MTVRNGDLANETTFNDAFMSRTSPTTAVKITVDSTDEASKPWPTMTTAQRDALTPVNGFAIYNSDDDTLQVYNGTDWDNQDSVESVNGKTGVVVLDPDDLNDDSTDHKFVSQAELDKLAGIEDGAQTNTVDSVAGKTGVVTLDKNDVGLDQVDNLSLQSHIDENPAHKEIDTKANLDTWASTAPNGADAFAIDEKKAYHVVDGALEESGGSGTGVGSPSIYELYNAEDGDLTDFTNITINTTNPINGLADYSVDAYPASLPDVTPFNRNVGKRNTLSFQYTITSGTAKIVIAGVELEIDNTNTRGVIEYDVDDLTPLTISIEDVSLATGLKLDDLVFSDAAREVKAFTRTNSINLAGNNGEVISASNMPFNGSGTGWNSGNREYTLQYENSTLKIKGSITYNGAVATPFVNISVNGSYYRTINNSPTGTSGSVKDFTYTSEKGEFNKGDTIQFTGRDGTLSNTPAQHYLVINEESETEGTVYSGQIESGEIENNFSANISNNGTASISSQNINFIDNIVRNSLGNVTVNFVTGFFTETPSIELTATNSEFLNASVSSAGVTTSGFTCRLIDHTDATSADGNFSILASRQGADYRSVTKDVTLINEVTDILTLKDDVAAPSAVIGKAQIYVDQADGGLKVIFGDGTVKTITTNP